MKKGMIITSIIVVVVLALFFFVQWRAANVIVNADSEQLSLGDNITGKFSLAIQPGDSLQKDMLIFISLTSSNNKVLATKTLTLDEFMKLSDENPAPTERDGDFFYQKLGTYHVDIDKVIPYSFNQKGDYELMFNILKLDLTVRKQITVS